MILTIKYTMEDVPAITTPKIVITISVDTSVPVISLKFSLVMNCFVFLSFVLMKITIAIIGALNSIK